MKCWWVLAGWWVLMACASNRAPQRTPSLEPVIDPAEPEPDTELEPAAGDAAPAHDPGCARIPRGAVCLAAGLSGLGDDGPEERFEERPAHAVRVGAFAIDRREVSRRAYMRCVRAGHCALPGCELPDAGQLPVRCISWSDAEKYCRWRGGRLPSEAEWERAAAGLLPVHRRFPWGDELPEAGVLRDTTPEGIEALGSGVAEWVADGGGFYPALPPGTDAATLSDVSTASDLPDGSTDAPEDLPERTESGLYVLDGWHGRDDVPWRVVRGGDDALPMGRRTSTLRRFRQPGDRLPWVGFRCAY